MTESEAEEERAMSKIIFSIVCVAFVAYVSGCGQKKEKVETYTEPQQEIMNETEALAPQQTPIATPAQSTTATQEAIATQPSIQEAMIPEKPTTEDIQRALKNAGLYDGKIDGVVGSKTKKAIEDFQGKNNLTVDGKVGQKTWEKLKQHLSAPQQRPTSAATDTSAGQ